MSTQNPKEWKRFLLFRASLSRARVRAWGEIGNEGYYYTYLSMRETLLWKRKWKRTKMKKRDYA